MTVDGVDMTNVKTELAGLALFYDTSRLQESVEAVPVDLTAALGELTPTTSVLDYVDEVIHLEHTDVDGSSWAHQYSPDHSLPRVARCNRLLISRSSTAYARRCYN